MRAIRGRALLLAAVAALWPPPGLPRPARAEDGAAGGPRACIRQFEAHAFAAAQACLTARAAERPAEALALFYLGRTYYERRQTGPAIEWLGRAVARQPERSEFHDWLGRAYGIAAQRASLVRQFGLAVQARQEFARAVELDPANPDALADLIEFQTQAPAFLGGSFEQASRHAAELERRDPLRGRLARAEIQLRQPAGLPAAERLLRAAAADFPGDPRPHLALAGAFERAARFEQAADELAAALQLGPDDAEAHAAFARVAVASGRRLDRAVELLAADLERLPPEDDAALADCHYALGAVLERQGDRGRAREHYREALRRDPGLSAARAALRRLR